MLVGKWVRVGCVATTAACNTIVGNDIGHLGGAAGGDGAMSPVADGDGGDSRTFSNDGSSSGCSVDGPVNQDDGGDAAAGMTCGFTMPNPASAGLPNAVSYTENVADGTITDNVTGLTWEGTVEPNAEYNQGQAVRHCEAMGGGWRLPTRLELVSASGQALRGNGWRLAFADAARAGFAGGFHHRAARSNDQRGVQEHAP